MLWHDAWAVGSYTDTGRYQTLIEHWEGAGWRIVPSPNSTSGNSSLSGIAAVSANDIWAVGDAMGRALTMHWDGTNWTIIPSSAAGESSHLTSVVVVSTNDVWAVGGAANYHTLTLHWDGSQWRRVDSPGEGASLNGVAAVSGNDVWAVGGGNRTLTIHWDGQEWAVESSGTIGHGWGTNSLYGVTAISTNDVWAVGGLAGGTASYDAVVMHWNGSEWDGVDIPNPSIFNFLYGVTALSANDVWAVGAYLHLGIISALIAHCTNAGCSTVSGANLGENTYNGLSGVGAVSNGNVWVVGGFFFFGNTVMRSWMCDLRTTFTRLWSIFIVTT
jgi:hypothetical protein